MRKFSCATCKTIYLPDCEAFGMICGQFLQQPYEQECHTGRITNWGFPVICCLWFRCKVVFS